MSDATGENAEAFQFLSVPGAFFEVSAIRDVAKVDRESIVGRVNTLLQPGVAALKKCFEGDGLLLGLNLTILLQYVLAGDLRKILEDIFSRRFRASGGL
jgi:hypothetical protein